MKMDFTVYFKKYEDLVSKAESVFKQVKTKYPEEVKCRQGCSDCCHALFDLTLIEAMYVRSRFDECFSGIEKKDLIEKANKADRQTYKIKKEAYRASQNGQPEEEIIEEVAQKHIRCPLLGEKDLCLMYDYRPIACRVYGIPQAIGGKGRTCGLSGFKPGENYPTLNHDIIHEQLIAISSELVRDIQSRHIRMAEMLVPLSMALLTEYNEEYLGVGDTKDVKEKKKDGEDND